MAVVKAENSSTDKSHFASHVIDGTEDPWFSEHDKPKNKFSLSFP
jgi:hypothetical protein